MQRTLFLLLTACLLAATQAAYAQARYTCRLSNGSAYVSDRPCSTGTVYYGPDQSSQQRYETPIPRSSEAPPHVMYMSPRCGSLHDAIRTARARGLTSETISTMQKGYQRECAENESEAYSLLSQEKGEKAQQRRSEKQAEKEQRDRASLRDQQCGESKRILVTKRARTDLNEGERAELQRFEANYRSRCG